MDYGRAPRCTYPDAVSLPEELGDSAAELFDAITTATRDGVAIIGPEGDLLTWNAAAAAITGWSRSDAAPRLAAFLDRPGALTQIREGKWVELRRVTVQVDRADYTVVLFTDSTAQLRLRDAWQQFRALGLVDPVTSLSGRELAMIH